MKRKTLCGMQNGLLVGLLALLVSVTTAHNANAQSAIKSQNSGGSDNSETVVLDVINTHFTMGQKIPSVYLRVFADHTAECHTLAYSPVPAEATK